MKLRFLHPAVGELAIPIVSAEDDEARGIQVQQILQSIDERKDSAFILAGDTNLAFDDELDVPRLADLFDLGELTDACQTLSCGDDRIDRVLFRSSDKILIRATDWRVDGAFINASGEDLSDHKAVAVRLLWEAR